MVPKSLESLLSRLKNLSPEEDSLEAKFKEECAPTAIKLIEEGIGEGLVRKFKKDQDLLESFVLQAAIVINPHRKEELKTHWEYHINKDFKETLDKLEYIDDFYKNSACKEAKTYKKMIKVRAELTKLKEEYLSKLKLPSKPNSTDQLINLFIKYLPEVTETFMDTHVRKMLSPFKIELKIELKANSVRVRKHRHKDEWFILQRKDRDRSPKE